MPRKKFDWTQFTQRVAVAAPVEKVFKMWTDPEHLRNWFLADAKIELRKGGKYEWKWLAGVKEKGKVLDVKKPSRISFTFAGSVCDVFVKKDKRGSLVILHQHDIPKTEKGKSDVHLNCSCGWTFYLTNLKTYLEYGIDLRENKPKFLKDGMVFN
jgi:uncharacterized protein YndB with AHSA1/START domain